MIQPSIAPTAHTERMSRQVEQAGFSPSMPHLTPC